MTPVLGAYRLLLYACSLLAVWCAEMAWGRPGLVRLIGEGAGLALTPALGAAVADALSVVGAARLGAAPVS